MSTSNLYVYKARHVVSVTMVDGLPLVSWVGFHPSATEKRGRRPNLSAVTEAELTALDPALASTFRIPEATDSAEATVTL